MVIPYMRLICRIVGHRWVFRRITVPRQMFCATCGKRSDV